MALSVSGILLGCFFGGIYPPNAEPTNTEATRSPAPVTVSAGFPAKPEAKFVLKHSLEEIALFVQSVTCSAPGDFGYWDRYARAKWEPGGTSVDLAHPVTGAALDREIDLFTAIDNIFHRFNLSVQTRFMLRTNLMQSFSLTAESKVLTALIEDTPLDELFTPRSCLLSEMIKMDSALALKFAAQKGVFAWNSVSECVEHDPGVVQQLLASVENPFVLAKLRADYINTFEQNTSPAVNSELMKDTFSRFLATGAPEPLPDGNRYYPTIAFFRRWAKIDPEASIAALSQLNSDEQIKEASRAVRENLPPELKSLVP